MPSLFVVAVATSLVSWLRTVTVAPGSAAWLESTTCPLTVARNSWAAAPLASASSSAALHKAWYDFILIIRQSSNARRIAIPTVSKRE